jgi:hypothetical protein
MNFSSNFENDILRQIEFGVYPSFFVTHEITAKILNTDSNWIFTSSYDQWSQEIKQTYQKMNDLLQGVIGEEIVRRDVLVNGVVAVTYANGKQIIVNYNEEPYSGDGWEVNGKDALIREVLP